MTSPAALSRRIIDIGLIINRVGGSLVELANAVEKRTRIRTWPQITRSFHGRGICSSQIAVSNIFCNSLVCFFSAILYPPFSIILGWRLAFTHQGHRLLPSLP